MKTKQVTTTNINVLIKKNVLKPVGNVISNFDIIVSAVRLAILNGLRNAQEIYDEVKSVCSNAMLEVLNQYSFRRFLRLALK